MSSVVRQPRRGEPIQSAKVLERRSRIYADLLAASASLFAERGMEAVSVEDIIAEVGISRRTFYGFFANKYAIIGDLLDPIFNAGIARLNILLAGNPRDILPGVVDFYFEQWCTNRAALELINSLEPPAFAYIESGHRGFGGSLRKALAVCEAAGFLRNGSAEYSFRLISRTAIPLLKVYRDHPDAECLYRDAMLSLLASSS